MLGFAHQKYLSAELAVVEAADSGCSHWYLDEGTLNYKQIVETIIECKWKGLIAFETRGITTHQTLQEIKDIYHSLQYEVI